jgi:hypothetical protein
LYQILRKGVDDTSQMIRVIRSRKSGRALPSMGAPCKCIEQKKLHAQRRCSRGEDSLCKPVEVATEVYVVVVAAWRLAAVACPEAAKHSTMWHVVSCLIGGMSLNIIFNVNKTLDLATKRCYITCILWLLSHDPLISCKGSTSLSFGSD